MRSSWMVRVLVASASAVCFILQTVFFCSNKKPFFKPVSSNHRRTTSGCYQSSNVGKGRQQNTSGTPEEEALLADEQSQSDEHQHESQSVQEISREEQRISRLGSNATWHTNPITRNEEVATPAAAVPKPAAVDATDVNLKIDTEPEAVQAEDWLPAAAAVDASNELTAGNALVTELPAQQQQADVAALPNKKQSIEPSELNLRMQGRSESDLPLDGNAFLQHLIDAQLGQPRFAVAKDSDQKRHLPATHSRTPGSLQALLDDQFGPPKFAVPKADAPADEVEAVNTDEAVKAGDPRVAPRSINSLLNGTLSQVLEEEGSIPVPVADEKHHLRLEVLTGPLQGHVFDTVDHTQEVRIGRLADCALSLADDPEVSSNHAIIQYHKADNCWKMKDVGSLNGSSLNGATLSSNRQPSQAHALATGDVMEFGSTTRVQVTCTPSYIRDAPETATVLDTTQQQGSAKPHFGSVNASSAGQALSLPSGFDRKAYTAGRAPVQSPAPNVSRSATGLTAHMMSLVGPPLAVRHHQQLGISLAVQQRLGTEHRRQNTGCEDVVHFELPWQLVENSPAAATSALFALFDGHQGVNAAQRAKEVLPQVLREKLLQSASGGSHGSGGQLPRSYTYHSTNNSHGTGLVLGRPASAQAALLRDTFLEIDARISMDEGCTATLLVLERDPLGRCVLQSANVGDSSAVLVQMPATRSETPVTSKADSMPTARSGSKPPVPKPPSAASNRPAQPGSPANHQPPSLLLPNATGNNNAAVAHNSNTQFSPRNSSTTACQDNTQPQHSRFSGQQSQASSQQSDIQDEEQGHLESMQNRELRHSITRRSTSGDSDELNDCTVTAAMEETAAAQPPSNPSNEQPNSGVQQHESQAVLDASDAVVSGQVHSSQIAMPGQTNGIAKLRGRTAVGEQGATVIPLPPGVEGGHLEGGGHWIKMSEDHRISTSEKERERLAQLGHKTVKTRLYGLNIARMLGDKFLKDERIGFIAEPHVSPPLLVSGPGCYGTTIYDTQGLQQASPAMLQGSPATSRPPKSNARRRRGAPLSQLFAPEAESAPETAADAADKQTATATPSLAQPVNEPMTDNTAGKSSPRNATTPHASSAAVKDHVHNGSTSKGQSSSLPPLQPINVSTAHTIDGDAAIGRTFVVVASDGLWDVISEGKAASILTKQCTQDPGTSVAELASLLLSQALTGKSKDDITVMVLEIHPSPDQ